MGQKSYKKALFIPSQKWYRFFFFPQSDIVQSDSKNVDAICVRGMCLYYQDNEEAAFAHFQQALKLAPDHKKAKEMYKVKRVWPRTFFSQIGKCLLVCVREELRTFVVRWSLSLSSLLLVSTSVDCQTLTTDGLV